MSAIDNKQLLQHIFAELSNGNSKPFFDSLDDDVTWTIIGTTRWSGTYRGKQAVLSDLLRPLRAQFGDQYTATALRIIAEGDHVVVEGRGRVTTKAGMPYHNTYCWIYRVADGKVLEVMEYMDTQLVAAVLGDPRAISV
jgi:ketosteroid isomerase-like protein